MAGFMLAMYFHQYKLHSNYTVTTQYTHTHTYTVYIDTVPAGGKSVPVHVHG